MSVRPIIYSGPMVRAMLEGRKTQTRRILKPQPEPFEMIAGGLSPVELVQVEGEDRPRIATGRVLTRNHSPYAVGDLRYVREAWRAPAVLDDLSPKAIGEKALDVGYRKPWCPLRFEADETLNSVRDWHDFGSRPGISVPGKFRQSMHMPRWASRLTLEVVSVKVERLQDISEEDAHDEGVEITELIGDRHVYHASYRASFAALWNNLHGVGAWDVNPWIVAPTFKVHFKNVDALLAEREAA